MQTEHLIPTDEFCKHYNVEYSFINSLQEFGLIQITTIGNTGFLDANHLNEIEKYARLHQDLDINPSGIEAITHLLDRLINMQNEILMLRNKLSMYENSSEADNYNGKSAP